MLSCIFKLNSSYKQQKNITKTKFHSAHALKGPTAMEIQDLATKAKPSFTSD